VKELKEDDNLLVPAENELKGGSNSMEILDKNYILEGSEKNNSNKKSENKNEYEILSRGAESIQSDKENFNFSANLSKIENMENIEDLENAEEACIINDISGGDEEENYEDEEFEDNNNKNEEEEEYEEDEDNEHGEGEENVEIFDSPKTFQRNHHYEDIPNYSFEIKQVPNPEEQNKAQLNQSNKENANEEIGINKNVDEKKYKEEQVNDKPEIIASPEEGEIEENEGKREKLIDFTLNEDYFERFLNDYFKAMPAPIRNTFPPIPTLIQKINTGF
jgi:hypothetical protein